ncbi:unnamed protein product [Peronospora effusa]|nr:unnamed protein product [Peronospora effusa]
MGKENLLNFLSFNNYAMKKSMRVAAKAAKSSAARLCAAATEASQPQPADTLVSAGSQHQPATPVAGPRSSSPREDVDPELVVEYSGESDDASGSKSPIPLPGSPRRDTSSSNATKRDRGTLSESMYREMLGSSDEADDSPNESKDSESSGDGKGDVSVSTDINARSVGTSVDTTQEALDRNVLRLAPDRKPWMLPKHLLDRWYRKTNERFPIPLFDATQLHGLDASAKNFRTENDYYIDVFLEDRWYGPHKKREADAFLQSWSAFITNVLDVGKEAWFQRLFASRNKFEKRSQERRPSVGPKVPSCLPEADSQATGRDKSSGFPSPRGDLSSAPRGSASQHEIPPADAVVERKPCPILSSDLAVEFNGLTVYVIG